MRVGTICFSTDQGIGFLPKWFYDHGIITDVVIIHHGSRKDHPEWFPGAPVIYNHQNLENEEACRQLIKNIDVLFQFETPFDWKLLDYCRRQGVKTVIVPNYECTPRNVSVLPDKWICPSLLDQQYFEGSPFIPIPVEVPWKLRTKAETFVHNAGNFGLRMRNGTLELLQALPLIKSPINLILRCQEIPKFNIPNDPRVTLSIGTIPHEQLHGLGDVCLRPEKFNGLSLPLAEAFASGMLCMTTDRFPMNAWLPKDPLIRVDHYQEACVSGSFNLYQEAIITPKDIASKIDEWFGRDIQEYSMMGAAWAIKMSWECLKSQWLEALEF